MRCTADRVAMLDDLQGILGACRVGKTRQLTQDINYTRAGELSPVLLHPLQPDQASDSGEHLLSYPMPLNIYTTAHAHYLPLVLHFYTNVS